MTRVVVDASALAAITFGEPGFERLIPRLDGATVFAPALLKFELASTALKKIRRQPADAVKILTAVTVVLDGQWGIDWQDIEPSDVVLLARETGLSAYDASYLWLAGSLGAELVTLDARLARAIEGLQTTNPSATA